MSAKRNQEKLAHRGREDGGGDQGNEPRIKVQKIQEDFLWEDDKVGCKDLATSLGTTDVAFEYHRKADYMPTFNEIHSTHVLPGPGVKGHIHLYKGFKDGLLQIRNLIRHMESSEKSYPVLLLHGIPEMGKSRLSQALAYYLAIEDGNAAHVTIKYNQAMRNADHATVRLCKYFVNAATRWTILDQCNVNCIDYNLLLNYADKNKYCGDQSPRKPIVMFTSGHYLPPKKWYDSLAVDYRVIDLKVDSVVVETIMDGKMTESVEVEDVLKVTNVYGRVENIISEVGSKSVTVNDMTKIVYHFDNSDWLEVLWLLLPKLIQADKAVVEESKNNPEVWSLEPEIVHSLSYILTMDGHPLQRGMNSILQFLRIAAARKDSEEALEDKSVESSEFQMYEQGEYFYYVPQVVKLHQILNEKYTTSVEKYKAFYQTYLLLSKMNNSTLQSLRGNALESLISIGCDVNDTCIQVTTGLDKKGVTVGRTHKVLAKDVEELCQKFQDIRQKGLEEVRVQSSKFSKVVWFELNVPGKKPFQGYDFAYVEITDSDCIRFDLLNTVNAGAHCTDTVNAETHCKDQMEKVLREVENTLGIKAQPYFLVPKENKTKDDITVGNLLIPVASIDVDSSLFLCN